MVAAVRAGASQRAVARRFGVSLPTVGRWVTRAGEAPLGVVDWSDRPPIPERQPRRTPAPLEAEILRLRATLRETSPLGEYGAAAIRRALLADPSGAELPTTRTIGRVLARRGALDPPRRVRRPAPPRGWYLPEVAAGAAELDLVDTIVGLRLAGGIELEILTLISLHGGLPAAWSGPPLRTDPVIAALTAHWRTVGLPGYVQFDNAMIFAGSHGRPDLGRLGRVCLALGVTPVFAPPREMGFQAAIESLNGRWQAKVWRRLARPADLAALQRATDGAGPPGGPRHLPAPDERAGRGDPAPAALPGRRCLAPPPRPDRG